MFVVVYLSCLFLCPVAMRSHVIVLGPWTGETRHNKGYSDEKTLLSPSSSLLFRWLKIPYLFEDSWMRLEQRFFLVCFIFSWITTKWVRCSNGNVVSCLRAYEGGAQHPCTCSHTACSVSFRLSDLSHINKSLFGWILKYVVYILM